MQTQIDPMTLSVTTQEQLGQKQMAPGLDARQQPSPVQMRTGGGLVAYLRKVWAIAAKDLRSELRAKESLSVMVAFSVLAVLIFGLAFDLRVPEANMVVPGFSGSLFSFPVY